MSHQVTRLDFFGSGTGGGLFVSKKVGALTADTTERRNNFDLPIKESKL